MALTIGSIRRLLLATRGAHDEKAQALQAAGGLYRRAAAVTDPLFAQHPFFDPRDLVQVKYEMLRRVQVEGHSVTQAAASFGFSRPAFYAAQAALTRGGLPALVPLRPGPRRRHKVQPAVLAFLQQARAENPRLGHRALIAQVQAAFGIQLHPRTIERVLGPRPKTLPLPPA